MGRPGWGPAPSSANDKAAAQRDAESKIQAKKTQEMVETLTKKLKDVEDLQRESKAIAEEGKMISQRAHDGILANMATLTTINDGSREGFTQLLTGQQAIKKEQADLRALCHSSKTAMEKMQEAMMAQQQ
eukprot:3738924-Pyramimonas_sp.AAC.1